MAEDQITPIPTPAERDFSEDEIIDLVFNTPLLQRLFEHFPADTLYETLEDKLDKTKLDQFFTNSQVIERVFKSATDSDDVTEAELIEWTVTHLNLDDWFVECSDKFLPALQKVPDETWLTLLSTDEIIEALKRKFLTHCSSAKDFIIGIRQDPERTLLLRK